MRILYASDSPVHSGKAMWLAQLTSIHTSHDGRALRTSLGRFACYEGVARSWSIDDEEERNEAVEWAEAIHCLESVTPRTLGRLDLARSRVWGFQWLCREKSWRQFDERFRSVPRNLIAWSAVGNGWARDPRVARFGPTILPNVVPIDNEIHRPIYFDDRERSVSFSPAGRRNKLAPKAVDETIAALAGLPLIDFSGWPFDRCMARRARCWAGVDEVATPNVNRTALETMALGVACVDRVDEVAERSLLDVLGADRVPIINIHDRHDGSLDGSLARLRDAVEQVLSDADAARQIGEESRDWMERYHGEAETIRRYVELYERRG